MSSFITLEFVFFLNKDPLLMSGLLYCFKDEEGRCFSD